MCFAFNSESGCQREDCRYRHEKGEIPSPEEQAKRREEREAARKIRVAEIKEQKKIKAAERAVVAAAEKAEKAAAKVAAKTELAPAKKAKKTSNSKGKKETTAAKPPHVPENEISATPRSPRFHSIKLYYFDIAGKGEPVRLALHVAGVEFEDIKVTPEIVAEMKANGKAKFGQFPCLEVTDRKTNNTSMLVQSAAILRFVGRSLAKPNQIYPGDAIRAAYIDSILDAEIDLFTGIAVSRYRGRYGFESIGNPGDKVFDQIRKDLNDDIIPHHLGNLEKLLESNRSENKWFGNTRSVSIADLCLVPRLGWLKNHGEGISDQILAPYPLICALMEAFYEVPAIAEYYKVHEFRI